MQIVRKCLELVILVFDTDRLQILQHSVQDVTCNMFHVHCCMENVILFFGLRIECYLIAGMTPFSRQKNFGISLNHRSQSHCFILNLKFDKC